MGFVDNAKINISLLYLLKFSGDTYNCDIITKFLINYIDKNTSTHFQTNITNKIYLTISYRYS